MAGRSVSRRERKGVFTVCKAITTGIAQGAWRSVKGDRLGIGLSPFNLYLSGERSSLRAAARSPFNCALFLTHPPRASFAPTHPAPAETGASPLGRASFPWREPSSRLSFILSLVSAVGSPTTARIERAPFRGVRVLRAREETQPPAHFPPSRVARAREWTNPLARPPRLRVLRAQNGDRAAKARFFVGCPRGAEAEGHATPPPSHPGPLT